MEARAKRRSKTWKNIGEAIFFLALTIFALVYLLKDDPARTFALLGQADFFPLLLAIALIFSTLLLEALNITLLAHLYQPKYRYHHGLINVMVSEALGVYVKAGGTLLQEITFTKQGVESENGASVLTMNFLIYQFSICVYSALIVIFGTSYVASVPLDLFGGMKIFYIGILSLGLQVGFLLLIIALAYWRGLHRLLLNSGINVLAKLHILKEPEETRRKLTLKFATYRIEMKRLMHHKGLVLLILSIDLVKCFINTIVPLIVLVSLGADLNGIGYIKSFFGAGYVQVISNSLGVGAPEIAFQAIFSSFLAPVTSDAASLASAADLLWRALSFYLLFLIGILSLLSYKGNVKVRRVFSNTATIYDLEAVHLTQAIDKKDEEYLKEIRFGGKKKNRSVLEEEELKANFLRLKSSMMETEEAKVEIEDEQLKKNLEETNKRLAEIEKETYETLKRRKPDPEVVAEANHEMKLQKDKNSLKQKKKEEKEQKKKAKQEEKLKKKLLKSQMKGSTVNVIEGEDGESYLSIENPSFALASKPSMPEEEKDDGQQEKEQKDDSHSDALKEGSGDKTE